MATDTLTTREIAAKIRTLIDESHAIKGRAIGNNRSMTEAEDARFTEIANEIERLNAQVDEINSTEDREAKIAAAEKRLKTPRSLGIDLGRPGGETQIDTNPASRSTYTSGAGYVRGNPTCRKLFGEPRRNGQFSSANEFIKTIHAGLAHPGLYAAIANEGTGSAGAFAVPEEFSSVWLDSALEESIIARYATIYPMASDTRKIPGFDVSSNTASLFGGIVGYWMAEGGEGTKTAPKMRMVELVARKLGIYCDVSNELLADGLGYEAQLTNAMSQATSWHWDESFIAGDGVAKPLGILNDPALITVSAETGQSADTISYVNVAKMYARLHPRLLTQSIWLANPTTIPELLQLNQGVETAPIFRQSATEGIQTNDLLLGRPLIFTEKCPQLGDKGDLILCAPSQFAIGINRTMQIERSNAPGWTTDVSSFRILTRMDGKGLWNKAITPKNGDSQSWCVALAARA